MCVQRLLCSAWITQRTPLPQRGLGANTNVEFAEAHRVAFQEFLSELPFVKAAGDERMRDEIRQAAKEGGDPVCI